jgi:hypothetical protein
MLQISGDISEEDLKYSGNCTYPPLRHATTEDLFLSIQSSISLHRHLDSFTTWILQISGTDPSISLT